MNVVVRYMLRHAMLVLALSTLPVLAHAQAPNQVPPALRIDSLSLKTTPPQFHGRIFRLTDTLLAGYRDSLERHDHIVLDSIDTLAKAVCGDRLGKFSERLLKFWGIGDRRPGDVFDWFQRVYRGVVDFDSCDSPPLRQTFWMGLNLAQDRWFRPEEFFVLITYHDHAPYIAAVIATKTAEGDMGPELSITRQWTDSEIIPLLGRLGATQPITNFLDSLTRFAQEVKYDGYSMNALAGDNTQFRPCSCQALRYVLAGKPSLFKAR